jgi:hypothetical protein
MAEGRSKVPGRMLQRRRRSTFSVSSRSFHRLTRSCAVDLGLEGTCGHF